MKIQNSESKIFNENLSVTLECVYDVIHRVSKREKYEKIRINSMDKQSVLSCMDSQFQGEMAVGWGWEWG